jgi:hypothetical protein
MNHLFLLLRLNLQYQMILKYLMFGLHLKYLLLLSYLQFQYYHLNQKILKFH